MWAIEYIDPQRRPTNGEQVAVAHNAPAHVGQLRPNRVNPPAVDVSPVGASQVLDLNGRSPLRSRTVRPCPARRASSRPSAELTNSPETRPKSPRESRPPAASFSSPTRNRWDVTRCSSPPLSIDAVEPTPSQRDLQTPTISAWRRDQQSFLGSMIAVAKPRGAPPVADFGV